MTWHRLKMFYFLIKNDESEYFNILYILTRTSCCMQLARRVTIDQDINLDIDSGLMITKTPQSKGYIRRTSAKAEIP